MSQSTSCVSGRFGLAVPVWPHLELVFWSVGGELPSGAWFPSRRHHCQLFDSSIADAIPANGRGQPVGETRTVTAEALLPQPGGFEGVGSLGVVVDAGYLVIPRREPKESTVRNTR